MNSSVNPKRNKNRSTIPSHSSAQNMNSKTQSRQKSTNERTVTPEGVYFNGRVMHATTCLVGCVVQVEVKDGTKYEGVLRTFSPEFELVIDYVAKVEPNAVPIVGSNIGNLIASLQAKNKVAQTLIFKFPDVVKLNAINVDLDYATSKSHMMTDTEISRFDGRQPIRDKELVPWEAECGESLEELEDHNNGTTAQNGWDPDDMFKTNEERFKVRSTYEPTLKDYTVPLVRGEGEDYEQRQAQAEKIANEIEADSVRIERYAKEDADDEEKYSAVVRPANDNVQHNRHASRRKPNSAQSSSNYNANSSASSGSRTGGRTSSNSTVSASSPPFHSSNKNTSNASYNKQQFSNSSSINSPTNTSPSYQTHSKSQSNTQQSYREEVPETKPQYAGVAAYGNQIYSKADTEETPPHTPHSHSSGPPNQHPLPQRNINENRRGLATSKRKEEMAADLKKFSTDFKLPPNIDSSKENVNLKSDSHLKNSAKSKSPVESTPVKDKSEITVNNSNDKELSEKTIESVSPLSPTLQPESEIAKKSTLNPNAKTFTPRSPLTPVNTSSTPPSVASTPSSTVSSIVPIVPQMAHQQHHHQQQQQQQHPQQPRFQNSLVQIPQYNVLPPGLSLPLGPNQYLIPNVAAMTPTFAQTSVNQQRTFRSKGPQQYANHGVRHDFSQPSAHVAAANVTGHPVLATAPIAAPQQIPVSYAPHQTAGMVAPQGPQAMYQHMYQQFQPRMNIMPPQTAMGMAMQHAVQYDPSQLQQFYATAGTVQLQHLVSQAHQHVSNSGPHSAPTTPQSGTPTTPLHGGPAPSPVHHQPNQPPTPTPQQTVMYATSPHNPQAGNVGHSNSGAQYQQLVLISSGQPVTGGHHSTQHAGPMHPHALSHNSTPGNPHAGPTALLPVHVITSNAAQNALAATFNANPGV